MTADGRPEPGRRARRWLVLDEVLAQCGDATAAAFREQGRAGSSPVAAAVAAELQAHGADVTRNSRAQWTARPSDPAVRAWLRVMAARADAHARYGGGISDRSD